MKTHKKLRNKLRKQSRRDVETLDSEPKEPARLSTDSSGHKSSPIPNIIIADDNAAALPPHEQIGSSARDSIFPSNGFRTVSEENHYTSTHMTRCSLDKRLERQPGQKDSKTNDRAVLAAFMPELCTATKQTEDTLVASRTHSQNADEIEHPFKVYYQSARPGLAARLIHAWKKWECCHCGSVTHYENHVCSRLACWHKRCEVQCLTLEASA